MRRAVGIFFFLGLILLGALTLWVDSEIGLLRKGGSYYHLKLPSASGLQEGAQVWLAGLNAGRITKIALLDDGSGVRVEFKLLKDYRLRTDSVASLPATSLLTNGRNLSLTPGTPAASYLPASPEPPGTEITRVQPVVGLDSLVEKADQFFSSIKDIGPVIQEAAGSIRNITQKIEKGEGTLGKLANDPKLYDDVLKTLHSIDESFTSLKNIANKVEKGEGTLGKLVASEELYKDLREASKGLADLSKKLSSGEGALGKLINDQAVYDDLKRATGALASVAEKIEKGDGTLGKLVNDDSLYVEARRFLREAREAVEDAREQAPITAFSSVIFAAFQ